MGRPFIPSLVRALVAMTALVTGGCAGSQHHLGYSIAPGSRYVAMGSSFAAGPGLAPYREADPRCMRSQRNYPSLLARKLYLALVDVSCSGAASEHVLAGWNELPAQTDALSADTRLVTVTVGGNDLGYVRGLIGSSCRTGAVMFPGPCWPTVRPSQEDYSRLETNLRAIARTVSKKAPNARLVIVQYVTLTPTAPCHSAQLLPVEATISREIGRQLANLTARVARETGAILIPADRLSRNHGPCSRSPWSNGMYPGYDSSRGMAWHPNAVGMEAIADAIVGELSR